MALTKVTYSMINGAPINVSDYGAVSGTTTDQSAAFTAAFTAAKAAGGGAVIANGEYYFTSNLVLQSGVSLVGDTRESLVLKMDGCYVTHEVRPGVNPACQDVTLRATIESVNGTELYGLYLAGIQYSAFDVTVDGFSSSSSIGIICTSQYDSTGAAYRYGTNNDFYEIDVIDCYKGIVCTKNGSDPATFGGSFNRFWGGYIRGYTVTGLHIDYGEGNTFFGTRFTTSIVGATGCLIEDAATALIAVGADGSYGGSVPGTENVWGFPNGRTGDLTSVGFDFRAGSAGSCLINYRGDGCYNRVTFDIQTTANNVEVTGRADSNWQPNVRTKNLEVESNSAATPGALISSSATTLAKLANFKNAAASSVYGADLKMTSGGALVFGPLDSDFQFIAGNTTGTANIVGRWNATTQAFQPENDGTQNLGAAGNRWGTVYAATGTINTSDGNEKQDIKDFTEAETKVAVKLKSLIKTFKFKDVVKQKGNEARIHFGVIAQDVKAAFESEGLVAEKYGVFCSDELEDGTTRLGIRYDELFAFIIGAL